MWLGHAELCRGSMDPCQPYQSLCRASVKPNIFEPDIERRNVLRYSMEIKTKAGSLYCKVLFWMSYFYPSLVLHIKKDWRLKNWGVFGLFLFKKLRNITAPVFFCFCWKGPLERVHGFSNESIRPDTLIKGCVKMNTKIPFYHKLHVTL